MLPVAALITAACLLFSLLIVYTASVVKALPEGTRHDGNQNGGNDSYRERVHPQLPSFEVSINTKVIFKCRLRILQVIEQMRITHSSVNILCIMKHI